MRLDKILFVFFFLIALSLIIYALIPGLNLSILLKLLALSIGITIIIALFYDHIRGAKKGDKVVVIDSSFLPSILGREGTLLQDARVGDVVNVVLLNGKEIKGLLVNYEDLLSPHKVRVIYEEQKI